MNLQAVVFLPLLFRLLFRPPSPSSKTRPRRTPPEEASHPIPPVPPSKPSSPHPPLARPQATPPTPPWTSMLPGDPMAHSPRRSAAVGSTKGSAATAAGPATSSAPAPTNFRPGVFSSSPPVFSLCTSPSFLGPGNNSPFSPPPPRPHSLDPLQRSCQPRTLQKTPAPANRGLAGRRTTFPHPPPLPHPLPPLPHRSSPRSWLPPLLPPRPRRLWRVWHLPGSLGSGRLQTPAHPPPPPHPRGAH